MNYKIYFTDYKENYNEWIHNWERGAIDFETCTWDYVFNDIKIERALFKVLYKGHRWFDISYVTWNYYIIVSEDGRILTYNNSEKNNSECIDAFNEFINETSVPQVVFTEEEDLVI